MRSSLRKVENLVIGDDGKTALVLLLRTYANSRQVYTCRIQIPKSPISKNRIIIQVSLGTNEYEKAKNDAYKIYKNYVDKYSYETISKKWTVTQAIDAYLDFYKENVKNKVNGYTSSILKNHQRVTNVYWREYIGTKNLDDVSYEDFEGYEAFRRSFAKNTNRIRNQWRQSYKSTVSSTTLKYEINFFKQFLRWCSDQNRYNGLAFTWRYRAANPIYNRREAFSLKQYKALVRYMRTEKFFNKGKHVAEGGRPDKRVSRHRQMLRAYIIFMANTGLRVGEARHLKWRDVTCSRNILGSPVCVASIDRALLQTAHGDARSLKVIGRFSAWLAVCRWKDYLLSIGEDANDEGFIFCHENGNVLRDFRAGFDAVISEAGVGRDRAGNKFVIYSLRHTYLSFRLIYAKKLSMLSRAELGDAFAQHDLAVMYEEGKGVAQDYEEAVKWYGLAAKQGHALSQNTLGLMYDVGAGVTQDYKEAVKWYRLAAEQQNANAQYNIGLMYENGLGVAQDYEEAVKWYRLAAEQGNEKAQANLGGMYGNGNGVIQNDVMAYKWFSLAALNGNPNGTKNRDIISRRMTVENITKAEELAKKFVEKCFMQTR